MEETKMDETKMDETKLEEIKLGGVEWYDEFIKDTRNLILEELELEKPELEKTSNINKLIDDISGGNKEMKDILMTLKTIEEIKRINN